ncbi:MAG: IS30 family transposase, partial [Pseudomonadota bacterium]|nr:IS30 family transposase [Pseudomonadota bacterium]
MGSHYCHLKLDERRKLAKWLEAKMPIAEIADRLGRDPSTIYRDIKRNRYTDTELPELNGYYALNAQDMYEKRRAIHRKMIVYPELKEAIEDRLKAGWSTEQIAGRLQHDGQALRVSHETIYAYVYGPDGQSEGLARYLPHRRKKRLPRRRRTPRGLVFPPDRSIHQRPDYVKTRETFGEWEGDLMIFERAQGKVNVASLVERKTRFAVLFRNNDRSTTHLMNQLMDVMAPLPQPARKSITFDRGIEFRNWRRLEPGIGTEAWFCDPQAPWQKGSVENLNKRARRYLPRDAPVATLSNRDMKSICDRLNGTPRKCLGWRTPAEAFREEL